MAFAQVAGLSDPIEDYAAYWLKFYQQGTTTPISMATDDTGGTLLAKAEVSSGGVVPIGFIKTAGDVIFIPYLDQPYDSWLFPTEAEADANDTSNAIKLADNVSPPLTSSDTTAPGLVLSADQINYDAGENFAGGLIRTGTSRWGDGRSSFDFMTAVQRIDVIDNTVVLDVTVALQLASDSLSGGQQLRLPAGSYRITATINLNNAGASLIGEGGDQGRTAWSNWPTRIFWDGPINTPMFEIDTALLGTIRGGTIKGMVLDSRGIAGASPIKANPGNAHWNIDDVTLRNFENPIFLDLSCVGWSFTNVEIYNNQFIGIELNGLNHHTTFTRVRCTGIDSSIAGAQSNIRVGTTDRCSNINLIACDLESPNHVYQVELMNARAVNVSGGYAEPQGGTAVFRLGVTATSACNGFNIEGFYVQGGDPTFTLNYVLDVLFGAGVNVGGGNHWRNITTAAIKSTAAAPRSEIERGNYFENIGGVGNIVLFDSIPSVGWTYNEEGDFIPVLIGLTTPGANSYTTQLGRYVLNASICHWEIELTLDGTGGALDSTGILEISGLPFTAKGGVDSPIEVGFYEGLTMAAGRGLLGLVNKNTTTIRLRDQTLDGTSSSSLIDTEATDSMTIKIGGNYRVDG